MELSKAQKVRLGTFVATGLVLFIGSALVLAGLRVWEKRDVYLVRFKASVSGLERSSQVKYQGLRVGRVEELYIAPDDPSAIVVKLSLQEGTILYEGTEAILDLSGITGLKTVNLQPGDKRNKIIQPGSLIPTGESLVDRLGDDAEVIAAKVSLVADQLTKWTDRRNRERVEAILDNFNSLLGTVDTTIAENRVNIKKTMVQLNATSAAVEKLALQGAFVLKDNREEIRATISETRASLKETHRILAAVDDKAVAQTILSAQSAVTGLDQKINEADLAALVEDLQRSLWQVTTLLGEMDLAVRASREDFVLSLKHVREASEDLREFSRIIAQDPSVLLRGTELAE